MAKREDAPDLCLHRGTCVAAGAQPPERGLVELDRFRGEPCGEDKPQQRCGRDRVPEGVVRLKRDVVSCADDIEAVRGSEWLEKTKRLERAGDCSGLVVDSRDGEPVPQHGEIEARVVRDKDGAVEQSDNLKRDGGESRRGRHVGIRDPVHTPVEETLDVTSSE